MIHYIGGKACRTGMASVASLGGYNVLLGFRGGGDHPAHRVTARAILWCTFEVSAYMACFTGNANVGTCYWKTGGQMIKVFSKASRYHHTGFGLSSN
jgi:hypothetical protein